MEMPPMDVGRNVLGSMTAHVVVHVRLRRVTRWRLRIGAWLFTLAGRITGLNHTTVELR